MPQYRTMTHAPQIPIGDVRFAVRCAERVDKEAVPVRMLLPGGTDGRWFTRLGIGYNFTACPSVYPTPDSAAALANWEHDIIYRKELYLHVYYLYTNEGI